MRRVVGEYDWFINNYRFRGAGEQNWGCPPNARTLELYLTSYTYKAICEEGISLDDLHLTDEYASYLQEVRHDISPEGRPVIVLHQRAGPHCWDRNLPDSGWRFEVLLHNLVNAYPDHQIVLLGEGWRYRRHPRVRHLDAYLNLRNLSIRFKDYSACLQFVLAAYFCRDADLAFGSLSGFTQFINTIRPIDKPPLIPLFWRQGSFLGGLRNTSIPSKWVCEEYEAYQKQHPEDEAFQPHWNYFIYYVWREALLKPYCLDDPNSVAKVFRLLSEMSGKKFGQMTTHTMPQSVVDFVITGFWKLRPMVWWFKRVWQILFVEHTTLHRIRTLITNRV